MESSRGLLFSAFKEQQIKVMQTLCIDGSSSSTAEKRQDIGVTEG